MPAPAIFAPIALRQSARSTISGSRAAFSITVSPLASVAAISSDMGGADRDLREDDSARRRRPLRRLGTT